MVKVSVHSSFHRSKAPSNRSSYRKYTPKLGAEFTIEQVTRKPTLEASKPSWKSLLLEIYFYPAKRWRKNVLLVHGWSLKLVMRSWICDHESVLDALSLSIRCKLLFMLSWMCWSCEVKLVKASWKRMELSKPYWSTAYINKESNRSNQMICQISRSL